MKSYLWMGLLGLGVLGCGQGPGQPGVQADEKKEATKGKAVDLDGLQSRPPADWKEEEASNKMRLYQFQVPRVKGDDADAELVIFYFGPGGGGTAEDNIARWKGMFVPPDNQTLDDVAKVEHMKVGDVNVAYLDVHGTYRYKARPFDPNAKEELRPDYRMLGVVFESPKGPYFIRLVGPAKTVEQHKKDFDDWLKGFK